MKKIGAITIGQAPRTDVMEDLDDILRGDVELIQAGALDLLTLEEVETLRPDGTGNTLVSRMRDGTGVMLQEQKILPLLQQRIHDLEEQGVSAILIMCTGEFPETFVSRVQGYLQRRGSSGQPLTHWNHHARRGSDGGHSKKVEAHCGDSDPRSVESLSRKRV